MATINPAPLIMALAVAGVLTVFLDARERLEASQERISELEAALVDAEVELEASRMLYESCMRDTEVLNVERNVLSTDLRRCDAWYAQREYAADADF